MAFRCTRDASPQNSRIQTGIRLALRSGAMSETDSDREDEARADWEGMGQTAFTTRPATTRATSGLNRAVAKMRGFSKKIVDHVRARRLGSRPTPGRKTAMKASDLMTRDVHSCRVSDTLHTAAQIMWNNDCGCVPVTDEQLHIIGMITDRDICMAALSQGKTLDAMTVGSVASTSVSSGCVNDSAEDIESLMRLGHVRRIPILDEEGRLAGIVSVADLARHVNGKTRANGVSAEAVAQTLAAVSTARRQIRTEGA